VNKLRMDTNEKVIAASILLNVILILALIVVAATYPHAPSDNVITYRGWSINQPSNSSSVYVATKGGYTPITGVDLPDLISDINEAER